MRMSINSYNPLNAGDTSAHAAANSDLKSLKFIGSSSRLGAATSIRHAFPSAIKIKTSTRRHTLVAQSRRKCHFCLGSKTTKPQIPAPHSSRRTTSGLLPRFSGALVPRLSGAPEALPHAGGRSFLQIAAVPARKASPT